MAFSPENPFKNCISAAVWVWDRRMKAVSLFLGELFLQEGKRGREVKWRVIYNETKRLTLDPMEAFAFTSRTPETFG